MTARKSSRRSRRSNTTSRRFAQSRSDPHAMTTIRAGNAMDPPQTTTNVVGFKRIRKIVNTNGGTGQLTLGDVRSCLPLTTPDVRFVKLSVWSTDEATLSCVFPVGSSTNVHPGDDSAWTDDGVPGNSRAQIHLTPAFDYRNFWLMVSLGIQELRSI